MGLKLVPSMQLITCSELMCRYCFGTLCTIHGRLTKTSLFSIPSVASSLGHSISSI